MQSLLSSKLLKNIEEADALRLYPLPYHTDRMISIENVSVSYGEHVGCNVLNKLSSSSYSSAISFKLPFKKDVNMMKPFVSA